MAFHTQQSLSGFIASDPQQSVTENGDTRFYVRVGQPHFREFVGRFRRASGRSRRIRSTGTFSAATTPKPNGSNSTGG